MGWSAGIRAGVTGVAALPDRWSIGRAAERDERARAATQRLSPGQLDALVLDYVDSQGTDAVGATAVAKALGRSAGAVGNCLTRLAAAGRVRQISDKPRRHSRATTASRKRGRPSRRRKDGSSSPPSEQASRITVGRPDPRPAATPSKSRSRGHWVVRAARRGHRSRPDVQRWRGKVRRPAV
jgi:hypothetical protein